MKTETSPSQQMDPWPQDPREQLALADALDARARVAGRRADWTAEQLHKLALRENAADLRLLAIELRDAAWRQMGA